MSPFYTLNHLLISRQEYEETNMGIPILYKGLSLVEISPEPEIIKYWIKNAGGPYGWDVREQYTDKAIEKLIKKTGTRVFLCCKDADPIGYCHIHEEAEFNLKLSAKIIQIDGFGLTNKQTNKGYGCYYLQNIFRILFNHNNVDYVYLTSRSTNHKGVIPFYIKNGMRLIHSETKPDDSILKLMPEEAA